MAVHYVKGGSGLLRYLGNNAKIVGMATGQPWLTALGMGVNAYNSGEGYSTPGFMNKNNNPFNWLGNPDMITQGGK